MPTADPRWTAVAETLVHYSAAVQPGERVMIAMGEIESFPLARAVYEACVKARAYPQVQLLSEHLRHSLLRYGSPEQHSWLPEIEAQGMDWADVYFGLRGAYDLRLHDDIPAAALAANQAALGKISTLRWRNTRWCLVRVPNAELARQAHTDLETIENMFFAACLMDYPAAARAWQRQAERLNGSETVRISAGAETELEFSVRGRQWRVFAGKINLPDGEIYTAPVNETLNGRIHFELPGLLGGKLVENIRLAWQNGCLVHASATSNEDFLRRILDTDAGSSRLGEFAFGMNPRLTRFCQDILYDEKIAGAVHLALGRAYPECGGRNQSSIHWDLVKDLRQAGLVYIDGVPALTEGKLLI